MPDEGNVSYELCGNHDSLAFYLFGVGRSSSHSPSSPVFMILLYVPTSFLCVFVYHLSRVLVSLYVGVHSRPTSTFSLLHLTRSRLNIHISATSNFVSVALSSLTTWCVVLPNDALYDASYSSCCLPVHGCGLSLFDLR